MKKIYALFMTLCLVISATAAPLAGVAKKSYPLYQPEVVKAELALDASMKKAPAATQGLQYDAESGELIRYYNETDLMTIDTTYIADGQLSVDIVASDLSDMLSLVLFVEGTVEGTIIPEGTYPITSTPAYGTAYASPGVQGGSVYPSFYGMLTSTGGIKTPLYFLESGNVVVEEVDGNVKISIDAANSNNVPMTIVYEVGGKSEKVEVKAPLQYDATAEDGALDYTFAEGATATATDQSFYGTYVVDAADASCELALLFIYPEGTADAETTIPAGTYTISDSQAAGTVLASSGVSSTGSISYSFFANMDAEGYLQIPLYFLVSGTVEVTKVEGGLKVEVNGLNSNDVPVHVVYDATPAPTTETVYFVNAQNWENVNAYAWDPVQNADWPGVAATKEAEQIGGYDVYSFTANAGQYANVIFNNGSGAQTADLVWTAGEYYVKDGWYTKEEAEAQLVKPVEYESVYFVNNQGWEKVNIYTWSPEVGGWPGVAMTKEAEQLAGFDVYSYTVEKGTSFGGMLFNNTAGVQTADLKWTAGQYFVKDKWYTKEEAEALLAGPVTPAVITYALMGVGGDWTTGIAMTVNPDNENEYVLFGQEIAEGDAVKVVTLTDGVATAWCGNVDEYSVEYTADDMGNIVLAPGKYDFYYKVAEDLIYIGAVAEPEIEWIQMDLSIANLTTEVLEVEGAKYLQLMGRDDMNDADVTIFLNNYTGEDKEYEVNAESSYMTFGGIELTVLDGKMTQTEETYTGIVHTYAAEEEMYVEFALTMYAAPATVIELTDAIVAINEDLGTLTFNVATDEGGYYAELAGYTAPGVHEGPQICLFETPEVVAYANYAETSVADGIITLKGEFTSFMGAKFDVTISGKLPVEEPVEKPESTYTENNLNTYAFGLESELTADASVLNVTYRLNNSNATSVNVLVYEGEEVVATIPGGTSIGKNVVEVVTAELPQGVELTWAVEVNGTSVEVPTQEEKMYSMYCPHGLAIDKDPESEYFGRILVADAMSVVKDKAGYLGSGIGAGLHAFNPSFTTDSTVYTGGNDFTRILASNGYQPWRVKISEDGRIFVSSLDLNGVVVWEVSKDLQTWTPVIAGTNDATDYNIYDAEGNFIAGLNCSMDVTGKGEDLKLLLYSTNNKGIAFNQSGYRLDEYALGTATTWTGTPKNILEGGKLGVVHTNVEFIYDGEGGYWFGASRAGNAGQPNLVHINAAGEQDYYTEDAGLYGGDGVLVHNGMLFKGKARTSGTVGNFGVWTIGKDADGKVTLTEKWSVVANGIGRNLNEFAVDYAENLYVVGNSGEKIIAYALPYSGQVVTPAASQYAFQVGEPVVPVEMVGVVKRTLFNGYDVVVLTHEEDGTAHIYNIVEGDVLEVSQEGVIAVDPENAGDYLAISDIALTEDGKLIATNYMQTQSGDDYVDAGYKRGETRIYMWDDLAGAPSILFTSKMSSNWFRSKQGLTMAVKGTSDNMEIFMTGIHATKAWARASSYRVIDGVYVEPEVNHNDHYFFYDINDAIALETTVGEQYELNASPLGEMNWVLDAEKINPTEIVESATNNVEIATSVALTEDLGKKYNGASYITVGEAVYMVAPFANPDGELVGIEILNITNGFDAPQYINMLYLDDAVAAQAAATAVTIVDNTLAIALVVDANLYMFDYELPGDGGEYEKYEDEITNLVIDLDNLVLIGGPSTAFQVDVYLPLGEYNMSEDSYQLTAESSIAVMGQDATFIEGYAYEIDAFTPSAKAVVRCEWQGMKLEFHLTMSAAPLEPTVVVVEDAVVEIEKYLLWGDMYDYALKMTGAWVNPADELTYPVLVEVPVYYPEATEPSEIMSTVTVGGWNDEDPWLGFGEGTLTVTTVDGVVTATGIVQNPMAGIAIDITISGKLLKEPTAIEDVEVEVKAVKLIKNGQLIINRDGKMYNAQGAIVK